MGKSEQAINDIALVNTITGKESTDKEKQLAFNELYSTHERQLFIYFVKALRGDSETAEDLVILTFEKVHKALDKFNSKTAVFSTWMYSIARNTLIDYTRKEQFEVLSIDALTEAAEKNYDGRYGFEIKSDTKNPEQLMVEDQMKAKVQDAISKIKNDVTRQVVILRFIDGLSFREAAKEIGVEYNSTIRVKANRAMEELEKILSTVEA